MISLRTSFSKPLIEAQDDKNVKEIFKYAAAYEMPYLTDVMKKVSSTIMTIIIFLLSIIMLLTLLPMSYARSLFPPMSVWFVL